MPTDPIDLTIGHSPDPDDAFMWWPLGDAGKDIHPAIDTGRFRFHPVAEDIEKLNRRAIDTGDLDITACSMHAYAHIAGRYALTACGASMGDGYGPKVVAKDPHPIAWLGEPGVRIAIPGRRTTAFLTLRLMVGRDVETVEAPFERIIELVASGEVDAGVVIHEAQLTYADQGLSLIADLGSWWTGEPGLPSPEGDGPAEDEDTPRTAADLQAVFDIPVQVSAVLGKSRMQVSQLLKLGRGAVVELDRKVGEAIDIYVNNRLVARGEVVVVEDKLGVTMTEIVKSARS